MPWKSGWNTDERAPKRGSFLCVKYETAEKSRKTVKKANSIRKLTIDN